LTEAEKALFLTFAPGVVSNFDSVCPGKPSQQTKNDETFILLKLVDGGTALIKDDINA